MKLSEAIRLGEFALSPAKGVWFEASLVTGRICGACAVGRAVWAAGHRPERKTLRERVALSVRYDGHVYYFDREFEILSRFVSEQWPWTNVYTHKCLTRVPQDYNAVVAYISQMYEAPINMSMTHIAQEVERLESIFDNDPQPVTIDVTPHVAGDATQLLEVK